MSDDEVKRLFDVFAERMEKRFDLLAEAVQHLDSKIDRKTDALERKTDSLEPKTDSLEGKIDQLTIEMRTGFRQLGARIDVAVASRRWHFEQTS